MKTNELNSVFDEMSPSEAQKNRMLAEILNARTVGKAKRVIPFARYAVVAAATVAVCAGAVGMYNLSMSVVDEKNSKVAVSDAESSLEEGVAKSGNHEPIRAIPDESVKDDEMAENSSVPVPKTDAESGKGNKSSEKPAGSDDKNRYEDASENDGNKEPVVTPDDGELKEESSPPPVSSNDGKAHDSKEEKPVSGGGGGSSGGGGINGFETQSEASSSGAYGDRLVFSEVVDSEVPQDFAHAISPFNGISYNEIKTHEVYSEIFPEYLPKDYEFTDAYYNSAELVATLTGPSAEYITVTISPHEQYDVIAVDDIKLQKDGKFDFSLDCGECYISYSGEASDAEEIYKMVVSSPCMN